VSPRDGNDALDKKKNLDHPANRNSIPRSSNPGKDVIPTHLSWLKHYICTIAFVIYNAKKIESTFTQKSIGLFCECMDQKELYSLIKSTGVSFVLPAALRRSL